jgi:hypothetical protein
MGNVAALAITLIFFSWRAYQTVCFRRQRLLRERVAYMLWVMADRVEHPEHSLTVS